MVWNISCGDAMKIFAQIILAASALCVAPALHPIFAAEAAKEMPARETQLNMELKELEKEAGEQVKEIGKQTEAEIRNLPDDMAKSVDNEIQQTVKDVNEAAAKDAKPKKLLPIE